MNRSFIARSLIATVLGWGVCVGLAQAIGPGSPEFPWVPPAATELPPGYPPVDNSASQHPIKDWWHRGRPLGCWASFNSYGCGSWRADAAFIFGSCRTFFGEACLKGAPPSALPPWSGIESGYYPGGAPAAGVALPPLPGYPAGGQPGCNCR